MRLSRLSLLSITLVMLTAANSFAGFVSFRTWGQFNGSPGSYTSPTSLTVGGATLTFTGVVTNQVFANGFATTTPFGTFSVTASTVEDFAGNTFRLFIEQFIPGVGSGSSVASITGLISSTAGNVTITFTQPDGVSIASPFGNVLYNPDDQAVTGIGQPSILRGTVNPPPGTPDIVPVPPAALAGLALFGLVGYVRRRRAA